MKVKLCFTNGPTGPFDEELEAESTTCRGSRFLELKQHSTFAPLGPGDVVEVLGTHVVSKVAHYEALYTVEATLHLPSGTRFGLTPDEEHPAMKAVAQCEEDWRRAAWVTRNTAFSFLVSSQTRGWIEDNVECHPYVEHVELVRLPDAKPDLERWLRAPAFA